MNDKTTPNQMRILLRRMRGEAFVVNENVNPIKKNPSMRDMLKITRKLNEDIIGNDEPQKPENKETAFDQKEEERKFMAFFDDMNVSVKFIDLEITDNRVFWGGTVDGIIQFVFKVTPDETTSAVEFNYLDDFSPDNPDNEVIVDKIKRYFDSFKKYWRDNLFQQ